MLVKLMISDKRTLFSRLVVFMMLLFFVTGSSMAQNNNDEQRRVEKFNLDDGLALQGYDPVSYFKNSGPLKGDPELSAVHKGVTYRFHSKENRNTFTNNPEKYEPLYGGYCTYSMLDGDTQSVNPEMYKIVDDQLLLFYRMRFGIVNALNRWNSKAEETEGGDQELTRQADEHWNRIMSN